ncbi:microfibril-associated glycoprotein 4-like [Haliotis cracherodii]|uniref:microfibril-associated glycoprotein 4-like n=1 Tax=Haliotis cracherodii TaxID=6455 RepID=UPI0039ECC9E9
MDVYRGYMLICPYVVFFIVFARHAIPICHQHSYVRIQELQDKVVDIEPLWKDKKFHTLGCAERCYRDSKCVSFFYNALSGSCQGHTKIYTSHDILVPKPGFKYSIDGLYANNPSYSDCEDIMTRFPSLKSGIYVLNPPGGHGQFQVYCYSAITIWTLIQRRQDGSVNFYRTWNEYKEGFGDLDGEFWLGNEKIWRIMHGRQYQLRIKLRDFQGEPKVANYREFSIGSLADNYVLNISGFTGSAGDSMARSNGCAFSARDRDLDTQYFSCAQSFKGGWWYCACHDANLNGEYNNTKYAEGINWNTWHGYYYSLKNTEMRIRPCC